MVVITAQGKGGLVGIVTRVDPFYSSVMPLTELNENSTKAIAATVLGHENDSFGIIESYNKETDKLTMTKIAENG